MEGVFHNPQFLGFFKRITLGHLNDDDEIIYVTYQAAFHHAEENSEDEVAERLWRRVEEVKQRSGRSTSPMTFFP